MENAITSAKKIVVKIGSSSLTNTETGKINLERIDRLAWDICNLQNAGKEVVLVSSGAIASGMSRLNMQTKPSELAKKQALACVGQCSLMEIYHKCFADYGYSAGQMLLTKYIFEHKTFSDNVKACIEEMRKLNIIPIINENDSVSVDEIKLGDNDNLSSMVARLINADLLIILSDIDGLYDSDPKTNTNAKLIRKIQNYDTPDFSQSATKSSLGTGGIQTKIKACIEARNEGIDCVIANSKDNKILQNIFNSIANYTHFIKK